MSDANAATQPAADDDEMQAASQRLADKVRRVAAEHPRSPLTVEVEVYAHDDHPEFLAVYADIGHVTLLVTINAREWTPKVRATLEDHFTEVCRQALAEVGR